MRTDLQMYKDFFDEMGIDYEVYEDEDGSFSLEIDQKHMHYFYENVVTIEFDEDENFVEFQVFRG